MASTTAVTGRERELGWRRRSSAGVQQRQARWRGRAAVSVQAKESRIGKQAVLLPQSVEYSLEGGTLTVSGPLGTLSQPWPKELSLEEKEEQGSRALRLHKALETKKADQFHGLFRTLTFNMVTGVSEGWSRSLQMVGVGYRAQKEEDEVVLSVGFANNVHRRVPDDLECAIEKSAADLTVKGIDKQRVGDFAAKLRAVKPPEPYKGKGVRYRYAKPL
jgi:large subunit ribosomal protein L6